jgi:hypothetical protein
LHIDALRLLACRIAHRGRFSMRAGPLRPNLAGGVLRMMSHVSTMQADGDVLAETHAWLGRQLAARPIPPLLVVIGLGEGHLLDVLQAHAPHTRVLALEPDPLMAAAVRARRDWSDWSSSGRLVYLVGPDYAGAEEAWRMLAADPDAHKVVVHPGVAQAPTPSALQAAQLVKRIVFGARANAEARKKFAGRYLLNTLKNLPRIVASPDAAALFGRFVGTPAIIVSAGPSLDQNMEALRDVGDSAMVIAVDTALRPLLEAGIEPHLVVAVDPSEINARHLQKLPRMSRAWLVAEGSVDPGAFEEFGSRTLFFTVSDHHPWPWLRQQGVSRGALQAWGSVATSAFDLAFKAGCDPIVFLGQDLGYTDGRTYCRGTTYEEDWAVHAALGTSLADGWAWSLSRASLLVEPDIRGISTAFTAQMRSFRDWLLTQCQRHPDRTFVNATGAGFLTGPGIQQRAAAAVVSELPRTGSAISARLEELAATSLRERESVAEAVEGIERDRRLEPWSAWCQFAVDTVSEEDLAKALRETTQVLKYGDQPLPASPCTLSLPMAAPVQGLRLPECAGTLRATFLGTDIPDWLGNEQRHAEASVEASACLAYAHTAIGQILELGAPLVRPGDSSAVSADLPAAIAHDWSATVVRVVTDAEAALAGACLSGDGRAAAADYDWTVVARDSAAADVRALGSTGDWNEVRGRFGLVRDLAATVSWLTGSGSETRGAWASVLRALVDTAGPSASPGPSLKASVEVEVKRRTDAEPLSVRASAVVDAKAFAAAATGLLLPVATAQGDESELWRIGRTAWRIQPVVIGPPLPGPVYYAAQLSPTEALVTGASVTESVAIDESGEMRPLLGWPRPINGEIRLLDGSGMVAWSADPHPYAMYRRAGSAEVVTEALPFRAYRALSMPDGRVIWTSFTGGLWSWFPGRGGCCLVETPPVIGLWLRDGRFHLGPIFGELASGFERVPSRHGWTWAPGETAVSTETLGPEGQTFSTDESNGYIADAHTFGHVVRIGTPDGRRFTLLVPEPLAVAWAGRSLVVIDGTFRPLVFPRLQTVLASVREDRA